MFKFEKLAVWQKSLDFADLIYAETRTFPPDERFALTNQIRRAATSISSNIAEGSARTDPDFAKFVGYASGPSTRWSRSPSSPAAKNFCPKSPSPESTPTPMKSVAC